MSIRQLIKRFGKVDAGSLTLNNNTTENSIVLAPFSQPKATTTIASTRNMSQLDYYYYLYAFWRGSMRFKLISETFALNGTTVTTPRSKSNFSWDISMFSSIQDTMNTLVGYFSSTLNIATTALLGPSVQNSESSNIIVDPTVEGVVEFEVPYYNISHISPATLYTDTERALNIQNMLKGHIPPCCVTLTPRTATSASNQVYATLWKAPGDDFSLSYIVGVPILTNLSRA